MNDKNTFTYTYSAQRKNEIYNIRRRYGLDHQDPVDNEEALLEELKKLDRKATSHGTVAGLTIGIVGILIMGTGMSMAMVWNDRLFVQGIIVGVFGMAIAACAYPAYKKITDKKKAELAPRIRELSDRLLEEDRNYPTL